MNENLKDHSDAKPVARRIACRLFTIYMFSLVRSPQTPAAEGVPTIPSGCRSGGFEPLLACLGGWKPPLRCWPGGIVQHQNLDVAQFLKSNKEEFHDDPQSRNTHLAAKNDRTPHKRTRRYSRLRISNCGLVKPETSSLKPQL